MKVLELIIDKDSEDLGVFAVSIVEKPAIQKMFVKFADDKKMLKFAVDEEKRIITGPAMIPDVQMYRSPGSIGNSEEVMVFFSEASVRSAAELFLAQDMNNNVTLQHERPTKGLSLRESWIIEDPLHDKCFVYGYEDLPKGTWMLSFNVNDPEIWESIKNGSYNGFSVEAFFIPKASDVKVDESAFEQTDFIVDIQPGESREDFIGRCIGIEIANGMENEQAAAVCYMKWEGGMKSKFIDDLIGILTVDESGN